mmetsp:Transcript_46128/g.116158  ORF Transcript_46128/g.116158 Transcript_46128/m.116158 type:complete len:244 (-) Transcript_46128:2039-2770(-)
MQLEILRKLHPLAAVLGGERRVLAARLQLHNGTAVGADGEARDAAHGRQALLAALRVGQQLQLAEDVGSHNVEPQQVVPRQPQPQQLLPHRGRQVEGEVVLGAHGNAHQHAHELKHGEVGGGRAGGRWHQAVTVFARLHLAVGAQREQRQHALCVQLRADLRHHVIVGSARILRMLPLERHLARLHALPQHLGVARRQLLEALVEHTVRLAALQERLVAADDHAGRVVSAVGLVQHHGPHLHL